MMDSPDTVYGELKGKTQEEIRKVIRSLKRDINQLKREMEKGDEDLFDPGRDVRISQTREALEYAIKAYEEAGGAYEYTKAEQKSREFDLALEGISKLSFHIGGFFWGYEMRTCTVSGDQVTMMVIHSLVNKEPDQDIQIKKENFITGLKNIHLGEWKKRYFEPLILDGTQWDLEIQFADGRKPVRFSGSNAYPYNFNELLQLLEVYEQY